MNAIEIKELSRRYGSRVAVDRLSLQVPVGSLFGFLGPNGAGKTTTIRVLLGFLRATAGVASIQGRDCWRHSARVKQDLGYVPGDLRLYSWLDCRSALRLVSAVRGADAFTHGMELARQYELEPGVRVRAMSRGMRQKLGLVLAMAHRPRILVLDEPTSGLDPLTQQAFREHLRRLAADGVTVFFSSHSLSEVDDLCDRVAIVRSGKLVVCDSLEGLRSRAGHDVMIRWRHPADAEAPPPPFLRIHSRSGLVWRASLAGSPGPLTAFLARHEVDDLTISRPDLESLFHRFYQQEATS